MALTWASKPSVNGTETTNMVESPIILLGIRDVPYLEAGTRNFKVKSGRDSGLKVSALDAEGRK